MVSVNLMRLSLEKAAYVVVFGSSIVGNPEFARDDKVEGGGLPWQLWRGTDRTNHLRNGLESVDFSVNLPPD
jgi:hypothetical protein